MSIEGTFGRSILLHLQVFLFKAYCYFFFKYDNPMGPAQLKSSWDTQFLFSLWSARFPGQTV